MKAILELCRLSNAPTCVTNVLVGAAVATGGSLPWMRVALTCVAIIALYITGMVLNDICDLEVDRAERPERPLPSGRVSLGTAWMLAVGAAAFGMGVLAALGPHAAFAGVALLALIVAYDALHKRFAWSVVLMGGCRALVYVVAAFACVGAIESAEIRFDLAFFALTMAAYIVGLSVVARLEASPDRAPKKWPALVLPAIVAVPVIVTDGADAALMAVGLVMTTLWLIGAARHAMARPPRVSAAVMAWLAGICLVDATFLAHLGAGPIALIAVACFLLTLWGHRHILGNVMRKTAVINVVGLSPSLIDERTPNLRAFMEGSHVRPIEPVLPAVTCSVQSSMLTGRLPAEHGIVGNGWYDRDLAEVWFWKQSNHLVRAPKIWDVARERDESFTCANIFWWYNMYSSVDVSVTPRPMYPADGRKIPDVYTHPADLRDSLQARLGRFPLFKFWGPAASIESTRWIAAAARDVQERFDPTLSLVYLPHLDYGLQKLGPNDPGMAAELGAVDAVVGDLLVFYAERHVRVVILSEYGITPVDGAVDVNRLLRDAGGLHVRAEMGRELLDAGASDAFAVADHQVAHVYLRDTSSVGHWADRLAGADGIETVLHGRSRLAAGLDHVRAGDVVLVAEAGKWFTHDYWLDDRRAPDFARTVDIHRKPGYDPRELFLDPALPFPKLKIAWTLLRKKLGFRTLMEVIPLDASLVRGSHGRVESDPQIMPVLMTQDVIEGDGAIQCTDVRDVVLGEVFGG